MRGGRFVYFLMFMPISDLDIVLPLGLILNEAALTLEFSEPSGYKLRSVVVVGEKKTREHSRGRASPPRIIGDSPELYKTKPSIP